MMHKLRQCVTPLCFCCLLVVSLLLCRSARAVELDDIDESDFERFIADNPAEYYDTSSSSYIDHAEVAKSHFERGSSSHNFLRHATSPSGNDIREKEREVYQQGHFHIVPHASLDHLSPQTQRDLDDGRYAAILSTLRPESRQEEVQFHDRLFDTPSITAHEPNARSSPQKGRKGLSKNKEKPSLKKRVSSYPKEKRRKTKPRQIVVHRATIVNAELSKERVLPNPLLADKKKGWINYYNNVSRLFWSTARRSFLADTPLQDALDEKCGRPASWYHGLIDHPSALLEERKESRLSPQFSSYISDWAEEARNRLVASRGRELDYTLKVDGVWKERCERDRSIDIGDPDDFKATEFRRCFMENPDERARYYAGMKEAAVKRATQKRALLHEKFLHTIRRDQEREKDM